MPAEVATTIWVSIIASVIRPIVLVVVSSSVVLTIIRIAIVATISIAIATIPVAWIPLIAIATIPVAWISLIAITTVLRHIAIYATLRIYRWSERRRYREREDAHQRQRNNYFLKSSVIHTPPFRAFRRLSWTKIYRLNLESCSFQSHVSCQPRRRLALLNRFVNV